MDSSFNNLNYTQLNVNTFENETSQFKTQDHPRKTYKTTKLIPDPVKANNFLDIEIFKSQGCMPLESIQMNYQKKLNKKVVQQDLIEFAKVEKKNLEKKLKSFKKEIDKVPRVFMSSQLKN